MFTPQLPCSLIACATLPFGFPGVQQTLQRAVSHAHPSGHTPHSRRSGLPPRRYLQFSTALQSGTAEEAERLHPELLADLYAIQVGPLPPLAGFWDRISSCTAAASPPRSTCCEPVHSSH